MAHIALLVSAKLGGAVADRLGQPAVLGALLAGVAGGGATTSGEGAWTAAGMVTLKAVLFIVGALVTGRALAPPRPGWCWRAPR